MTTKLDEIKWRLANRTVAYLLPGQPPDTTAHDDMTILLELVDMLSLSIARTLIRDGVGNDEPNRKEVRPA